jgi:orotate phosphoribosyltransferase
MPIRREEVLDAIMRVAYLRGNFQLRSGQWSSEYVDKYRFEAHPRILRAIAELLAERLPKETEVIAGMELGGVPLAVAVSFVTGLPCAFVRKQAKGYGTGRRTEGYPVTGRRVVLVEDVVTTGGQALAGVEALRQEGAQVLKVLCVLDRQQGASQLLGQRGIPFEALFTLAELRTLARIDPLLGGRL